MNEVGLGVARVQARKESVRFSRIPVDFGGTREGYWMSRSHQGLASVCLTK